MTASFNLIDDAWLPAIDQQGLSAQLSLRDLLLQAHTLQTIHGSTPLETAALLRLVLAVLYRVVDLPDESVWAERWQGGAGQFTAEDVDRYLRQPAIYRQFELLGPGPRFLQYPPDPKARRKSTNSLILHYASGNNGTLFDHHRDDEPQALTPAEAARGLLVAQAFGVCGLSGLDEKFTDGPWAKGIIFVVAGTNLFQTLMVNLVPQSFREDGDDDRPVWEQQDPFADGRSMPYGVMDILTWPNRRIWFEEDMTGQEPRIAYMRWSPGLRLAETYRTEPMKLYRASEEYGLYPLQWSSNRALWRNSAVIFRLALSTNHAQGYGPLATRMLGSLYDFGLIERSRRYRLLAFGMLKDQASIEFFQAEELPLRLEYLLDTSVLDTLKFGLELAEGAHTDLTWAVMVLARGLLNPSLTISELAAKPSKDDLARAQPLVQSWNVARLYWGNLEGRFSVFVDHLPDDPDTALAQWRGELKTVAQRAFEHAEHLARVDDRSYRAIAYAYSLFHQSLRKRLA